MKRKLLLSIFLVLSSNLAMAHPTSYKGAVGVMSWSQPWLSDFWTTYSFEANQAIAVRYMRMEMPEGKFNVYLPQYNILLKRWNEKNSQANIYAYGGFGGVEMSGQNGTTYLGGVEADAESRSLFIMGKAEVMRPSIGPNFDHYEFRLGVAPYEAEFNEIASWFMVQYQYHPALIKKQSITPLGRFFYKNVLWESGVSTDGDFMLNLMFHF